MKERQRLLGSKKNPILGGEKVAGLDGRILCPACKSRTSYKLGDGRRKCKRCGKKFSKGARKPRISKTILKEVVRLFWLMVPAERAAIDLDINRKTVLSHINGIENFWGFAKRRLKMYHGGWKKNFRLFLKEMEFRVNHGNEPDIIDRLYKRVLAGPV